MARTYEGVTPLLLQIFTYLLIQNYNFMHALVF